MLRAALFSLLLSTAAICFGSLVLGAGVLALCGAREWSWLAAPVGFSTMLLLAVPALHVPGRSSSVAIVTGLLILAGVIHLIRRPAFRPPAPDLLSGLPIALLLLVPFIASGRAGTLGVSVDNDMGAHMLLAEGYRSTLVAHISPLLSEYPLGPHALVAALVQGLGVRTDLAFAGLTAAGPILLGWTALARVQRAPWLGRTVAVVVSGIPFLVTAYYGEGSFKELFEAQFVLASALILAGFQPQLKLTRWIPLALVMAGAVSVYSVQGLAWPAVFIAVWLAGRAVVRGWHSGLSAAWRELCSEIVPGTIAAGVMIVVLAPQIPRVVRFISKSTNNGIAKTNIGNLIGPLPGWEGFGVWSNPDFRLPPELPFRAGMWTALVLGLVLLGVVWSVRRRQWTLPMAAALAMLIWAYSNHSQSPYIAAKALVIASPLLLLTAVTPLVESLRGHPGWWRTLAALLAVVLLGKVIESSWQALRISQVGPTTHLTELRSLRAEIGGGSVLFLGEDDFIRWELAGVHVTAAYINRTAQVPLRAQKAFAYGQALDFDSTTAQTLNGYEWVITTRDAAGSAPPPQMRLARETHSYELWRRVGEVAPRETLDEGQQAAAVLDCSTADGRRLSRSAGVAAVRAPSSEVAVPPLLPGAKETVTLGLAPGTWNIEMPYEGPLPLEVSAPGLRTTLPANLELPGSRWPVGRYVVSRAGPVTFTVKAAKHWLTPKSDVDAPGSLIATSEQAERVVPLRRACGRLVDWYRL